MKKHIRLGLIVTSIITIAFVSPKQQSQDFMQEMLWIQGNETKIGFERGYDNEKPVFYQYINSFWMDKHPVTVGQFKKFIKLTRYVTDAEKQEKGHYLDSLSLSLVPIPYATWQYPWGKDKPKAEDNQMVTQISWNDAKAYATWIGKRLPTEFEWEHILQNPKKYALTLPKANQLIWLWTDTFYRMYQETGYRKHRLNETKTLKGGKMWDTQAKTYIQRPSLRVHFAPETSCANFSFFCAKDAEK